MCDSTHVPVAVVVNSLTLTQGPDLVYTSVADWKVIVVTGLYAGH